MSAISTPNDDRGIPISPNALAPMEFCKGFLWGVSTAAHQVEGNSQNQWSDWEAAGRIRSGDACGSACDWWNNAERDFDLARNMGLNAMRFSVDWSRIEPHEGEWDLAALRRYREMLDGLVERGICPMICLHHFTHPRWFEQKGAFLSPDAPELFERFTRRVVGALGEHCNRWLTFNEPNVYSAMGYVLGEFPPGRSGDIAASIEVVSAMARSHLRAYRAIHELQPHAEVGWAHHYVALEPVRRGPDRWIASLVNELFNESFLRLMQYGKLRFPLSMLDGNAGDVKGSCDFVGLNVYSRFHVAFDLRHAAQAFARLFVPPHVPQGDSAWERPYGEAYPLALRRAVERAKGLGKPVYILENGVPDAQDRIRPWLIVNAVRELHQLIAEGHDLRGYFHWTLTDNFEWTEGWHLRFGLVALDTATQERTMRNSGRLYSEIARRNGISQEMIAEYGQLESATGKTS
jgi:beta-glucosidase